MYGPTTNQADEWASLGPIKLLDILYLDEDLMLLRGNANVDALFVYQSWLFSHSLGWGRQAGSNRDSVNVQRA